MPTRYKLRLAYDGTAYSGWQTQPNGVTVQEVIEAVLNSLGNGQRVTVHGSGRTDKGVHARAQVAHVDLDRAWRPVSLRRALNGLLPADIRVLGASPVAGDFHARKSAVCKEYRYFIWNAEILPPVKRRYYTQVRAPLDVNAMRRAAAFLEGRHDFASFTANPRREVQSTIRRLDSLRIRQTGSEIVISAVSEGFLYKMVRSLAGFLIRVGEGKEPPSRARDMLHARERTARVPTAPPQGLFLWRVRY